MNELHHEVVPPVVALGVVMLLAGSVTVWLSIVYRLIHGLPVLPFERRRPVPWRGIDLAAVLLIYLLLMFWTVYAVQRGLGLELGNPPRAPAPKAVGVEREPPADEAAGGARKRQVDHPVFILLRQQSGPGTLLFVLVVAGVIVPIAEEFTFRLLIQGWLEAIEQRWRRRIALGRRLGRGVLPVTFVAAMFALMHWRTAGPPPDMRAFILLLAVDSLVKIFTLGFAVWLIWHQRGAMAADFGFVPQRLPEDLGLGLLAFLACVPPVLLIQNLASNLLPEWLAPDPIALFFFALALGILYYRTHRIVPSMVLHMALNMTSVAITWLLVA